MLTKWRKGSLARFLFPTVIAVHTATAGAAVPLNSKAPPLLTIRDEHPQPTSPPLGKKVTIHADDLIDDEESLEKICQLAVSNPSLLQLQLLSGTSPLKKTDRAKLSGLRECHNCRLDRLRDAQKRADFENKVIDDIRQVFPDREARLNLTSFASGQLFQEFTLLNKLYYRGYRSLRINLIDPIYANMFKLMREVGRYPTVTTPYHDAGLWSAYQFSHYFTSVHDATGIYEFDIRYYDSTADYLSDIKSGAAEPAHIVFNIDSSVYEFTSAATSELGVDLERLIQEGLHPEGVVYTLAELSDRETHAHKTTQKLMTSPL